MAADRASLAAACALLALACAPQRPVTPPTTAPPASLEAPSERAARFAEALAIARGEPHGESLEEGRLVGAELLTGSHEELFDGRPDPLAFPIRRRALAEARALARNTPDDDAALAEAAAELAWAEGSPAALPSIAASLAGFALATDGAGHDRYLAGRLTLLGALFDARRGDRVDADALTLALDGFDGLADRGDHPAAASALVALREHLERAPAVAPGDRSALLRPRLAHLRGGAATTLEGIAAPLEAALPPLRATLRARLGAAGPAQERAVCTDAGRALLARLRGAAVTAPLPLGAASAKDAPLADAIVTHDLAALAAYALRGAVARETLVEPAAAPTLLATLDPAIVHGILARVGSDPRVPVAALAAARR